LAADPSDRVFTPAESLLAEIRRAPVEPAPRRQRHFWRRLSRGAAVLIAALVVGGAVAWATTGTSPLDRLERIWGIDRNAGLSVDETGYGLDDFSILEPMTDETFDELPERLKFWLAIVRAHPSLIPDDSVDGGFRRRWIQEPRQIAGWGETTTDGGERVAVVSMNGKICMINDGFGAGSCESVARISKRGMSITTYDGVERPRTMLGLVTDDVVSLKFKQAGYGPIELKDNVFDVTGLPIRRSWILGLDQDGAVVTRIFVSRQLSK
jgi:hypothetical protein